MPPSAVPLAQAPPGAPPMLDVAEAARQVDAHVVGWGTETVPLGHAPGHVLAAAVHAERDQPPFDRVMMDGIALRARPDLPRRLRVAGTQLAGMPRQRLDDGGACIEVTTGAVLPEGCDCVVPVERLERQGMACELAADAELTPGRFVHRRGSDCRAGRLLLEPGTRIDATVAGVLAANGVAQVTVARLPAIAVVATGDELVEVDAALDGAQIRRSNDHALAAALATHGLGRVSRHRVCDDLAATTALLGDLLGEHDLVVLCGGVSRGQRDYVPAALAGVGVRQVFHRVAQRPGKPLWFGTGPRGQVVFGLPGNPVSVLACAARYLLPTLERALGAPQVACHAVLQAPVEASPELARFVPVRLAQDAHARVVAMPRPVATSGDFSSLPGTDGVVEIPPGVSPLAAGAVVALYRW